MPEITRNLSVALRPRRFSEVIGYGRSISFIKKQFGDGRVPTVMMFVGVSRGGKTTLARIIAASINCEHAEFGEPCDECIEMAKNGTYAIQEINAAVVNKVEDARDMVRDLDIPPFYGKYRVIILDECQMMTKQAQNVWLKELEKDYSFNIVIFGTTDPGEIIAAIQKRAGTNRFNLEGLNEQEVKKLVWETSKKVPLEGGWNLETLKELSGLLWERDIVAPGDIVNAVEGLLNGKTPDEAAVSCEFSGKVNIYRLINAVYIGDWNICREELGQAEARDGAELLVRLGASLRGKILENNRPEQAARYSRWIDILLEKQTPIVGLQLGSLVSSIWQFCNEVKGGTQSLPKAA